MSVFRVSPAYPESKMHRNNGRTVVRIAHRALCNRQQVGGYATEKQTAGHNTRRCSLLPMKLQTKRLSSQVRKSWASRRCSMACSVRRPRSLLWNQKWMHTTIRIHQKLFRGSDSYKAGELERETESPGQSMSECVQNVMNHPLDCAVPD